MPFSSFVTYEYTFAPNSTVSFFVVIYCDFDGAINSITSSLSEIFIFEIAIALHEPKSILNDEISLSATTVVVYHVSNSQTSFTSIF